MRYRATGTPLVDYRRQVGKEFLVYTDATSESQAGRFLRIRYPYPKYLVENIVPDPREPAVVFAPEEVEDIKQIAEYLKGFYEIWNACELREYSYEEILLQGIDEFLRRRRVRQSHLDRIALEKKPVENPSNPGEPVNYIQSELARLGTDLEIDLSDNNFKAYRDTIIAMLANMSECKLPDVMDNYVFAQDQAHGLIKKFHSGGYLDVVDRFDKLDSAIKQAIIEIATTMCKCDMTPKTEEIIYVGGENE